MTRLQWREGSLLYVFFYLLPGRFYRMINFGGRESRCCRARLDETSLKSSIRVKQSVTLKKMEVASPF